MSVTGIVSGVYGVGKTLGINLDGVFGAIGLGGASCSSDQKKARSDLAQAIAELLTPQEMAELVSGMEGRVPPNPEDMAYFFFGEEDCKHKNVGSRHQQFLDELPQVLKQKEQELQDQQDYGYGGNGSGSGGNGGAMAGYGAGLGMMPIILILLAFGGLFIATSD